MPKTKKHRRDFNKTHPELLEGEVWMANVQQEQAERMSYITKRVGNKAYDSKGKIQSGLYPVFVKLIELRAAGFDPDSIEERVKQAFGT